MTNSITITKPDDWHLHLRDGMLLKDTVNASANEFKRALVMPNLIPPLTTVEQIKAYRQRILDVRPDFKPYFSLYLTENTSIETLKQASQTDFILGAKLYPAGATTNSEFGIKSIKSLAPLFKCMQELDLVLQIHGETTTGDIFEREAQFIEQSLKPLINDFPKLRIVLEHISTKAACEFVKNSPDNVAATITIHHLIYNRNDLLAGGIKPHFYCLPILKHASDQAALQQAALSANKKFFLGTDSAPHAVDAKESACGCAGIYSAPYALPLYTQFFDLNNKLDLLENFASHFGADFYQLAHNKEMLRLEKISQQIPNELPLGAQSIKPIEAGKEIFWSLKC